MIPGSGRSSGEGTGYPLQYSRVCGSDNKESTCNVGDRDSIPGLARSPEGGHGTHSNILVWRIPKDRGAWRATVHGVTKSWTPLSKHSINTDLDKVSQRNMFQTKEQDKTLEGELSGDKQST